MANVLQGVWTYRSFYNRAAAASTLNDVLLAEGQLVFETAPEGGIRGELTFPDFKARLTLKGSLQSGAPTTVRFQGVGDDTTSAKGWVYDYIGYLVPNWPNGQDQVTALVGSIIRTVPHAGGDGTVRPAGAAYSFIAVQKTFVEPRDIIPLPSYVLAMQASRHHRLHHLVWHYVRNGWLSQLDEGQRQDITNLGWNPGDPPRPAQPKEGSSPIIDNGSGEDFLFMHRQMVDQVRSTIQDHSDQPLDQWIDLPAPASSDQIGYAVPPTYFIEGEEFMNRRLATLKSDEFFWARMRWWDRQFKNPAYLQTLTLGQLGALIEFSVHNDMHMRWSSLAYDPVLGTPLPGGRAYYNDGSDISTKWDLPTYDYLGDFYSSHVNPVFWRLHGWVDDRIEDWFESHQKAHPGQITKRQLGGVAWFYKGPWVEVDHPWSGPAMMAHIARMQMSGESGRTMQMSGARSQRRVSTGMPNDDEAVKTMEKVWEILNRPAAARAARRAKLRPKPRHRLHHF
jgi:hypothetical protein